MLPGDLFNLLLVAQGCQELGHGLAARRYLHLSGDLGQRGQEEESLSEAWMGQLKLRLIDPEVAAE